jgi:hypothetical protein
MRLLSLVLTGLFLLSGSVRATLSSGDSLGAAPILLGLDTVRAELRLDALQRAVLDSLRTEYKGAVRKLTTPMPATPGDRAAAEKQLVALNERFNQRALSVLNSTQKKRFAQIEHHVLGATVLYSRSVQKKVGVTPAQQAQIAASQKDEHAYTARINRQFEEGKISHHDRIGLLRAKRLAEGETLLRLLTPEQRDALSALSGPEFAL